MPASIKELGDLHSELTKFFTEVVKGNITDDDGKELRKNASMMSGIRQFLKDNNIDAELVPDGELEELTDNLPDFDEDGNVVQLQR